MSEIETTLAEIKKELYEIKNELIEELRNKDQQIKCNVEIVQKLIKGTLYKGSDVQDSLEENSSSSSIPKREKKEKKDYISLEKSDEIVKINGNTFNHRHLIKQLGCAQWVQDEKIWVIPLTKLEELEKLFSENNVKFQTV